MLLIGFYIIFLGFYVKWLVFGCQHLQHLAGLLPGGFSVGDSLTLWLHDLCTSR